MTRDSRTVLDRPAPPPAFTVAYGQDPDQVADVRLGPRPGPLVLLFHGGFWRHAYDRAHLGPLATALAAEGYVVATPEYRRTGGGGGWPATFDDVAAAVRLVPGLVRARTAVVGEVVLAGHSAGGHLALWAASPGSGVAGVVALAPVADLRAGYDLDLDQGAVAALLGGGPDELLQRYAEADPLSLVPLGCRVRVIHGNRDAQVPLAISQRFAEAARAAGDDATLTVPDADHFDLIDPIAPVWGLVCAAFAELVADAPLR